MVKNYQFRSIGGEALSLALAVGADSRVSDNVIENVVITRSTRRVQHGSLALTKSYIFKVHVRSVSFIQERSQNREGNIEETNNVRDGEEKIAQTRR